MRRDLVRGCIAFPRNGSSVIFWSVLLFVELVTGYLHLPSLRDAHIEGDEIVFTFLAERLRQDPFAYHLRGVIEGSAAERFLADTRNSGRRSPSPAHGAPGSPQSVEPTRVALLDSATETVRTSVYDSSIYGKPMFFHPPVYVYTLAGFRRTLGGIGGALLSILTHGFTILLVALLGRRWGGPTLGLLAATLVSIDPVSWLCGSRVWIDGMTEMMMMASMLTMSSAVDSRRNGAFILAGMTFGIACLTKYPGILVGPALMGAALVAKTPPTRRQVGWYLVAALALVGPWILLMRFKYGAWVPDSRPTPWLIDGSSFVARVVNRPWYFYPLGLLMVAPVYVYCVAGFATIRTHRWLLIPLIWALGFVCGLTLLGLYGYGFQLRYLAPAMPAFCLLCAAGIVRVRWLAALAVPLSFVTFLSGYRPALQPGFAEPIPVLLDALLNWMGSDLSRIAPQMW